MARRINNRAKAPPVTEGRVEDGGLPGGAPGIPEEAVAIAPAAMVLERDPEEIAKLPAPKLYRIAAGKMVLYGGVPTVLRAGKTVSDSTHDLQSLRMQGVVLEEVPHGY